MKESTIEKLKQDNIRFKELLRAHILSNQSPSCLDMEIAKIFIRNIDEISIRESEREETAKEIFYWIEANPISTREEDEHYNKFKSRFVK